MDDKVRERAKKKIKEWYWDPLMFVEEGLGLARASETLPDYRVREHQRDYLMNLKLIHRAKIKHRHGKRLNPPEKAVVDKFGISIRSGQGPGKTTVVAWTIIWYLITHKNAILPCIAPKAQQLKENVWKEVGIWIDFMQKWGHPFIVKDQLVIQSDKIFNKRGGGTAKEKWAALMQSASTSSDASEIGVSIAGKHGRSMIHIVEEAAGVPDALFEVVEGNMTDAENFAILIFNPIKDHGYAYDTHNKEKDHWLTMHWNTLECDLPKAQLQKQLIKMERWGENDRRTRVRILGEFPEESDNAFITMQQAEDAFDDLAQPAEGSPFILALDPAGAGRDKSVCIERRGHVYGPMYSYEGFDELHIANWVLATYGHEPPETIMIDSNGIGGPIAARLEEMGFNITRVNPKQTPRDKNKFSTTRDELMWGIREPFMRGSIKIRLDTPEHTKIKQKQIKMELTDELLALSYDIITKGRFRFCSKDQMKKQLGRSPDYLDALCLATYHQGYSAKKMPKDHRYKKRRFQPRDSWMC